MQYLNKSFTVAAGSPKVTEEQWNTAFATIYICPLCDAECTFIRDKSHEVSITPICSDCQQEMVKKEI